MVKVINLKHKKKLDKDAIKLYNLGIDIDQVILHYIDQGCDPKEVTVILGHRLSELLKQLGDEKEMVWETVSDIILERLRNG